MSYVELTKSQKKLAPQVIETGLQREFRMESTLLTWSIWRI